MKGDCCAVVFQGRVGLALGLGPSTWVLVAKVGAEQNACTSYTRRRRGITAVDGGSIPPISTMRVATALLGRNEEGRIQQEASLFVCSVN